MDPERPGWTWVLLFFRRSGSDLDLVSLEDADSDQIRILVGFAPPNN